MKIASWNVNSLRVRLPRVTDWIKREQPDVLCLQELKLEETAYPHEAFTELGYSSLVYGQKTYNGVAIIAKSAVQEVARGFNDATDDPQARFLAARAMGIEVYCAYVPNGQQPDSPKYIYKMEWIDRLGQWLRNRDPHAAVLCGDFNVAPEDTDVEYPDVWRDTVLCNEDIRSRLRQAMPQGWRDSFRLVEKGGGFYSWWDYRQLGFPRNDGLRIDHIYITDSMTCLESKIDRDQRKGKQPSDHVPVVAHIEESTTSFEQAI